MAEEDPLNLATCLRSINQRIVEFRSQDYQIGHSYFMPINEKVSMEDKLALLEDIWNFQVFPLLKENFYSQPDLLHQILPSFFNPEDTEEKMLFFF